MKKLVTDLKKFIEKNDLDDTRLFTDMEEYAQFSDHGHSGVCAMTFEGRLYESLNYEFDGLHDELDAICKKHGVFFELGNGWNCSFYKK